MYLDVPFLAVDTAIPRLLVRPPRGHYSPSIRIWIRPRCGCTLSFFPLFQPKTINNRTGGTRRPYVNDKPRAEMREQ